MLLLLIFLRLEEFPYVKIGPFSDVIELNAGSYIVECYGAQGGNGHSELYGGTIGKGGKGTYIYSKITISNTSRIHVNVGGQGKSGNNQANEGGFNGGGKSSEGEFPGYSSGGGGGATDIRLGDNSPSSRILVAAGGSGAVTDFEGAPGGDLVGRCYKSLTEIVESTGTTQTKGGANGQGEDGKDDQVLLSNAKYPSSGGGGGWRGGVVHKGVDDFINRYYAVADSGSSFVSGYFGCETVKGTTFDFANWTVGEHEGDGKISISVEFMCPDHCMTCTDNDTCTQCTDDYILYDKKCYSECPEGTRKHDIGCELCPTHCNKCDTSKDECESCDNQTFIYNHKCYENCSLINEENHFGTNENERTCIKCEDEHCSDCSSNFKTCESCTPPFILDEISKKMHFINNHTL